MRKLMLVLGVILLALGALSTAVQASGCLSASSVIGPVRAEGPVPPAVLPAGAQYALYWYFHTWCPSCQRQAGEIRAFRARHGREVVIYAVPLSGTSQEIKKFLGHMGLAGVPVLWEADESFGPLATHPVMVFRKPGNYSMVRGLTSLSNLDEHYQAFKR